METAITYIIIAVAVLLGAAALGFLTIFVTAIIASLKDEEERL